MFTCCIWFVTYMLERQMWPYCIWLEEGPWPDCPPSPWIRQRLAA